MYILIVDQQKVTSLLYERLSIVKRIAGFNRKFPQWEREIRFHPADHYGKRMKEIEYTIERQGVEAILHELFNSDEAMNISSLHMDTIS